jgi:dihydroorotate dehydrogenase electron transfer subunit
MNNEMFTIKIIEEKKENSDIKTILFSHKKTISPGQFYMIWVPGIDEIPMSVSTITANKKGITFRRIGDATKALFQKTTGDVIGIRGPYGNGFSLEGKKLLFVAGGTGIAMIAPAVELALKQHKNVTVILGAKTKNELFFVQRLQKTNATIHITTDDGSKGTKGYATDKVKDLVDNEDFDAMYTCGPEVMMKTLYHICEKKDIIFEASLERYMKCGVGLCGQCVVGKGLRVCVEGPVFSKDKLKDIPDFGEFTRDASGKKVHLTN